MNKSEIIKQRAEELGVPVIQHVCLDVPLSVVCKERKDKLLEAHRYINVEWEDWQHYSVYDPFFKRMQDIGIVIDESDVTYSGFCSQGDGARFTCWITGNSAHGDGDFDKFCKAHGIYDDYPILDLAYRAGCDLSFRLWETNSRYCHANTVSVEMSVQDSFTQVLHHSIESDDFRYQHALALEKELERVYVLDNEWGKLEKWVTDIVRGYMNELYSEMYDLYYHLISDESVWESIVANDLHLEEVDDESNLESI